MLLLSQFFKKICYMSTLTSNKPPTYLVLTCVDIWLSTYLPPPVKVVFGRPPREPIFYKKHQKTIEKSNTTTTTQNQDIEMTIHRLKTISKRDGYPCIKDNMIREGPSNLF